MTRNAARQIAVKLLYSADFIQTDIDSILDDFFSEDYYATLSEEDELFSARPEESQMNYIRSILTTAKEHIYDIDGNISKYSSGRRIERISRTALAVLRCALCEIMYFEDIPESVSINEAVEIAKQYDTPETVSFINGVLGSFSRNGRTDNVLSD